MRPLEFGEVTGELLEEGFRMMYGELYLHEDSIDEDDFINGYEIITVN